MTFCLSAVHGQSGMRTAKTGVKVNVHYKVGSLKVEVRYQVGGFKVDVHYKIGGFKVDVH